MKLTLYKKKPTNDQDLLDTVRFAPNKEANLGEWENEFKEDELIVELVVGGAKSYSYRTNRGKLIIKQKGITMDTPNSDILSFDAMKEIVLDDRTIHTTERYQFKWDGVTKDIVTKFISRSIHSTMSEKRTNNGYDSVPYGFEE